MADRRQVKKSIRQLQRVKTWQLLILFILVAFIAATFLRLNNIGMMQRRDAVLSADKAGDIDVIQSRLYDLQRYVSSHMNANTEEFYLEEQYKRDAQKIIDAAKSDANPHGNVNAQVDAICRARISGYGPEWIRCFSDELAKFPSAPDPTSAVKLPNASLYRHQFAAPLWSPDFAGFSVLLCGVILLMIVIRLVSLGVLRLLLKRHYRGI